MNRLTLTNFSLKHPILTVLFVLALTVFFAAQFPKVSFDNDPENMLSEEEYVRIFHKETKQKFGLYDFVIIGIVNETNPNGIFNPGTLKRIDELTKELISLQRGPNGKPSVIIPARGEWPEQMIQPELQPEGAWQRMLAVAFSQDHERLFDEEGNSCIIASEVISPSVVDNIRQAQAGQLAIEYLMEEPPQTDEEAAKLRDYAMNNPLYKGTLVSEDGKAIALYIPIIEKTYSYNVAKLVERLTEDWPEEDRVYITGQPVAQDTFGVEMLVQMATSAPMAGLVIFILLYAFFRRISLIMAPMLLAVIAVVCTMGLLIAMGFKVHIMSSMIAIFLMPIAVSDSVHMLSEFYDTYARFKDKRKTLTHVISHLFQPMLFTTLTTIAGFASLATTPIPPVRVFGAFVAFGVALAWLFTMTFIPAYVVLFAPTKSLNQISTVGQKQTGSRKLNRFLEWLGSFSYMHYKAILALTVLVVGFSVVGLTKIKVNDNPVKWFTPAHRIRVADEVLNSHFGGTYTAYLTLDEERVSMPTCHERSAAIRDAVEQRFSSVFPQATKQFVATLDEQSLRASNSKNASLKQCFFDLAQVARELDEQTGSSWTLIADMVIEMDPDSVTMDTIKQAIAVPGVAPEDAEKLMAKLAAKSDLTGADLQDAALNICDEYTAYSFEDFVYELDAELTAPLFKRPEILAYVQRLQQHLNENAVVGKTTAVVDALKKAYYELNYIAPDGTETPEVLAQINVRNASYNTIPPNASANGQVYTQLEGMKKKDSLFHMVTRDYQEANIWVQLKSGDNRDMESVLNDVDTWIANNPPPVPMRHRWAGLTYLNVEWQKKMVTGMMGSLFSSFVVVLIMMMLLFRSPLMGLLSMIPLSVTIIFIYGLIGWVGKDYDMPVAVLSALTLGLSVDFAIHFLQRAREEFLRANGSWSTAIRQMFKEPAMAISRNAIVISVGFTPLLFAPLVPYRTVGFFMATIMAVSWISTLFVLAAGITALQNVIFKRAQRNAANSR